jgi:hypothetical protein
VTPRAHPVLITLPTGTGHTLTGAAWNAEFLAASGMLLLFRGGEQQLLGFLRQRAFVGLTAPHRWVALPPDLRPEELIPPPAARYDFVRLGRILAAACPPGSQPLHRTANGRFEPVPPDPTGRTEPTELARLVDVARRIHAGLGRRSELLEQERLNRSAGPIIAAVTKAGRLDAGLLAATTAPHQRFGAAAWWWQVVDDLTTRVVWR